MGRGRWAQCPDESKTYTGQIQKTKNRSIRDAIIGPELLKLGDYGSRRHLTRKCPAHLEAVSRVLASKSGRNPDRSTPRPHLRRSVRSARLHQRARLHLRSRQRSMHAGRCPRTGRARSQTCRRVTNALETERKGRHGYNLDRRQHRYYGEG